MDSPLLHSWKMERVWFLKTSLQVEILTSGHDSQRWTKARSICWHYWRLHSRSQVLSCEIGESTKRLSPCPLRQKTTHRYKHFILLGTFLDFKQFPAKYSKHDSDFSNKNPMILVFPSQHGIFPWHFSSTILARLHLMVGAPQHLRFVASA